MFPSLPGISEEAYAELTKSGLCYDFIPSSTKIVVFDIKLRVSFRFCVCCDPCAISETKSTLCLQVSSAYLKKLKFSCHLFNENHCIWVIKFAAGRGTHMNLVLELTMNVASNISVCRINQIYCMYRISLLGEVRSAPTCACSRHVASW